MEEETAKEENRFHFENVLKNMTDERIKEIMDNESFVVVMKALVALVDTQLRTGPSNTLESGMSFILDTKTHRVDMLIKICTEIENAVDLKELN